MEIDGGCLCGHITYTAIIDPAKVAVCHCTDCQVNSASAFRFGVVVRAEDFRLLSGTLKVWVKTAESGNPRALSFCPECGTSIHGGDVGESAMLSLRLGTARQRHDLPPKAQIWCRSALGWVGSLGSLRRFETQPAPRRQASGASPE